MSVWLVGLGTQALAGDALSPAPDLRGLFEKGNQAYLNGDYDTAVSEYRKVLEAGVNHPDLAFNLANAYYRSGRKGLAVLFYEKALQMDPVDGAAASNLEIVRKSLIDRVVMPEEGTVGEPLWHGFIRGLSFGWLSWMFFSLYLVAFGILIGRRLMRNESLRRLFFWINIPVITLALVFGGLFASRIYLQEKVHHGVVIPTTAALREGPEQSAKVQMEVHEGLKVRLLNEVGDHTRVKLANGVEGFILSSQIGRI
jgi:tetratricopeptide (TPR) repeat protein